MNCREVNRLLPLWIGNDLADAAEAEALRVHLTKCQQCSLQRENLQLSLDALQSISTTSAGTDVLAPSLWPRLAMVLTDSPRRRDHFNGWIPASAMALAAALMVTVSAVQIHREIGAPSQVTSNQDPLNPSRRNLFQTDPRFGPRANRNQDLQIQGLVGNPAPEF